MEGQALGQERQTEREGREEAKVKSSREQGSRGDLWKKEEAPHQSHKSILLRKSVLLWRTSWQIIFLLNFTVGCSMIRNLSGLVVSFRGTYVALSLYSDSEQVSSPPLRRPHSPRQTLQEQTVTPRPGPSGSHALLEQQAPTPPSCLKYGGHSHGSGRQAPPLRAERVGSQSHPWVHKDSLERAVWRHDQSSQRDRSMCWKIASPISLQSFLLHRPLSPIPSLLSETRSLVISSHEPWALSLPSGGLHVSPAPLHCSVSTTSRQT